MQQAASPKEIVRVRMAIFVLGLQPFAYFLKRQQQDATGPGFDINVAANGNSR
jgi:hypothetical protein